MRTVSCLTWVAACLASAATVHGYPTALNIIPTAETLGAGAVSLQLEADSAGTPLDAGSSHSLYLQLGLTSRLEVGADTYRADGIYTTLWNAKHALVVEGRGWPGVALGVLNAGGHSAAELYAIATRNLGALGLHAGATRTGGRWEALAGACVCPLERLSLQADLCTGSPGYATLGASWSLTDALTLTAYHLRTHERVEAGDYTGLNLAWGFSLPR